jgi:predicted nucleic acid-binding protein
MPARVADASVLAALAFREPRADEAAQLLADAQLYEPPLLAYELASVCRKKIQLHPSLRDALLSSLDLALSLDIRWTDVDQPAIVELAVESDLTTYDASYLWLSRMLDLPLVTFDRTLGRFGDPQA